MFERRGLVLLEEEMPDPRESVSDDRQQPEERPCRRHDRIDQRKNDKAGSNEMKTPAGPVTVFAQVEGIEIPEGSEACGHLAILEAEPLSAGPLILHGPSGVPEV
jgi:hypothetical protein